MFRLALIPLLALVAIATPAGAQTPSPSATQQFGLAKTALERVRLTEEDGRVQSYRLTGEPCSPVLRQIWSHEGETQSMPLTLTGATVGGRAEDDDTPTVVLRSPGADSFGFSVDAANFQATVGALDGLIRACGPISPHPVTIASTERQAPIEAPAADDPLGLFRSVCLAGDGDLLKVRRSLEAVGYVPLQRSSTGELPWDHPTLAPRQRVFTRAFPAEDATVHQCGYAVPADHPTVLASLENLLGFAPHVETGEGAGAYWFYSRAGERFIPVLDLTDGVAEVARRNGNLHGMKVWLSPNGVRWISLSTFIPHYEGVADE